MSEKTKEVGVRLSVKDADVVRKALLGVGSDGEKALKLIDNAARRANPSLVNLSNGIQRSKTYAREFAAEAARSFLGPVAAIATAAGAVEVLRDSIEQVNKVAEQGDLAERIGIAVSKLQGLQATFKESGDDVGELNGALETFATNMQKALSQGGTLKEIFDLNKVKITGDTLTDLKTYADLVKNAGNQQQRLYLVTQAFGKGSKELNDLMVQGGEGISHSADEAERLGTALTDIDVGQARETVKVLAETNLKLDASKEKFGLLITPAVIASLDAFNAALTTTRDLFQDIQNQDRVSLESELKSLQQAGTRTGGLLNMPHGNVFAMGADMQPGAIDANAKRQSEIMDELRRRATGNLAGELANGGQTVNVAGIYAGLIKGTAQSDKPSTILPTPPDAAAAAAAKAIAQVTDALKLQSSNLYATNREQEINNELSKAHVTLASDEGKEIARLAGSYYDQKQAIDAVNDATAFLAQTGESVFESLIDGTKSWQDVLGDVAKTLEKAVLQASLLGSGPLAGLFGTQSDTAGGTGGLLGGLLGGLFKPSIAGGGGIPAGGFIPGLTGPKLFASGGIATSPSIFGDRGPEAAVPLPDGRSIPVTLRGGDGGAMTVSVSIIHQPGAGQDSASATRKGNTIDVRAVVRDMMGNELMSPGSPADRALRVRFGLTPQTTRR